MIILPFFKLSPGGNMTVLLDPGGLSVQMRAECARRALSEEHLGAQQVGFIDLDEPRLDMAGGEFCVNALRCFGIVLAAKGKFPMDSGGVWRGKAACSGLPEPAEIEVAEKGDVFESSIRFELAGQAPAKNVAPGLDIVFLPGIVHLLLNEKLHPRPCSWEALAAKATELRRKLDLEPYGAAGCIWWKEQNGEYEITPVVWVKEPESLCLESSCGSGSLALALLRMDQVSRMSIAQPGGSPLCVELSEANGVIRAFIGGKILMVAEGKAFFGR